MKPGTSLKAKQARLEEVKQISTKPNSPQPSRTRAGTGKRGDGNPPRRSRSELDCCRWQRDGSVLSNRSAFSQLLKRPEIVIEQLAPILQNIVPSFFERTSSVPPVYPVVKISSEVRNELKSSKRKSNTPAISTSNSAPSIA